MDPIHAPQNGQAAWIITQEIRDQQLPLKDGTGLSAARNFAPWGEFRTFSDEIFAAAQARCVQVGRSIDPTVRVGFEGGEASTPLTGYDWARQLRELGSIESYDLGNGPEYIRSMRYNKYGQRIFSFLTLFDAGDRQNAYTLWYRLLHYGVTGAPIWCVFITTFESVAWVRAMSMLLVRPCLRWNENFFKNDAGGDYSLTRFALGVAPVFHEFESGLVKLLQTAEWDDSEVALLYSMPSNQISWMMDSEVSRRTVQPLLLCIRQLASLRACGATD